MAQLAISTAAVCDNRPPLVEAVELLHHLAAIGWIELELLDIHVYCARDVTAIVLVFATCIHEENVLIAKEHEHLLIGHRTHAALIGWWHRVILRRKARRCR